MTSRPPSTDTTPVNIVLVLPEGDFDAKPLRMQLRRALTELGTLAVWTEQMAGSASLPKPVRHLPGPFVMADGTVLPLSMDHPDPAALQSALKKAQIRARRRSKWRKPLSALPVMQGILIAFFPKCAACWAAYFSVFNSMGLGISYAPWLKHVLVVTLVLSLAYFLRMAIKRKKWLPFGFQAFGILLVAPNPYWLNSPVVLWVGVSAIFIGSLLYAMPGRWLDRIEESVLPFAARKMQSSPGEGR